MVDTLQAIFRTFLEPLLYIPMPWRLLVVILGLIPIVSWLAWRVFPWLVTQAFKLFFLTVEAIGGLLLYPGYLFINSRLVKGNKTPIIYYFADNFIRWIVIIFYIINQYLEKAFNYILENKRRWTPHVIWYILTTFILLVIWFIAPFIRDRQAGKLIYSGVNNLYFIEGWIMTGKRGLSPLSSSPEQFIMNYFYAINSGEYEKAWNLLSPNFINNSSLVTSGYTSYIDWWRDRVEQVEIEQIKLISNNINTAKVEVSLRFLMKQNGKFTKLEVAKYKLVWSSAKGTWIFHS